ncbi:MAG: Wzz/FepE/Etk N-terminal domain-containing protein [Fusobacteriaceae bacterium]
MNKEIEKYCEVEDEIDLYELVFIMLKNKKIIMVTTLIITLLSLGISFYIKENTHIRYGLNIINDYTIDGSEYLKKAKINVERESLNRLLNNDEVINEIFKNKKIKDLYFKTVGLNSNDIFAMREFLLKRIIINTDKKKDETQEVQPPSLEFNFFGDRDLSIEIGDLLIKLYTEKFLNKIYEKIDFRYDFVYREREKLRKDFEEIDLKIKNVMNEEFSNNYNNLNLEQIIALKYPVLFSELGNTRTLYNKYNDELLGFDGFKNDKNNKEVLKKVSSYYEIETKSKAKLIAMVGMILGFIAGIALAFIREFVVGYKKRYSSNGSLPTSIGNK